MNIFKILNKTQSELLQYCKNNLDNKGYRMTNYNNKFLFGVGNIPVLLVAHLDTVHKERPEIYFDSKKGVLWSPNGIGGDDRCGVYAILKICETHKPYVLLTTDEEIGGLGALEFCESFKDIDLKKYIKFIIEIDRRGCNQAVFYDCGNKDFQKYILSFGFEEEFGTFSDISFISPQFDIASVNLSAGYYNEHTSSEYIVIDDLAYMITKIIEILDDKKHHKYYDFQEIKYVYKGLGKDYKAEGYGTIPWYVESDWHTLSNEEWEFAYGYKRPKTYKELQKCMKTREEFGYFDY